MNLQSPLKFDKSTFFTYELIPKDETQKYIEQFDKSATRIVDENQTKFSFTFFGRDHTATILQWDVSDVDSCWEEIKDELNNFYDTEESRKYVKDFSLFLVQIPYFPYDAMILKSELDSQKINQVKSYNDFQNIFSSINQYIERFQGIIYKSGSIGKSRPFYVKFEVEQDEKNIQNQLKKIAVFEKNKKLENKKQIEEYYKTSKFFRIDHFDKDWKEKEMQSLVKKQNSFSVIGFLDFRHYKMTYCNFEVIFRKKERQANWARNTVFRGIDYDFSTYFHFVSIHLYLYYMINNLDKLEVKFENLVSEYRKIKNKDFKVQEELYQKISDLSENLFFINSDLNLIRFEQEKLLSNSMQMLSNYNLISDEQYSTENYFSRGMLEATFENGKNSLNIILEKLSQIQKKTDDLRDKFDKKIIFENSAISVNLATESVKTQKNMSWQGWFTILLTLGLFALTIALLAATNNLLIYTTAQFEIENFPPEFDINYPEIVLIDDLGLKQLYYLNPLTINSLTSHNYVVTIYAVEDSFEVHGAGKCLLGDPPPISLINNSTIYLESGANEESREPSFRLSFDKFPYSIWINHENATYHSVGSMTFNIEIKNLQIEGDEQTISRNAKMIVPVPSKYYQDTCK